MTTFNDREKACEEYFAHGEELKFKARALAATLFGEWAAKEMGITAEPYAREILDRVLSGRDNDELLEKVANDAANKGIHLPKAALSEKFSQCQNQAHDAVTNR